jgi:hypothetical protein
MPEKVSQASAFRQHGQSGTAGHGLVRYCPSIEKSTLNMKTTYSGSQAREKKQSRLNLLAQKLEFLFFYSHIRHIQTLEQVLMVKHM